MIRTTVRIVLGASLAIGVAASPAQASAPQRGAFTVQGTRVHDDLCAFPVTETYQTSGSSALFSDRTGLPVNVRTIITSTATFTNEESGRSATDSDHYSLVLDLVDATVSSYGLVFHVTTGHGRPVLLDAGRVVLGVDQKVIVEDGPHQYLDGDLAAFCAALS